MAPLQKIPWSQIFPVGIGPLFLQWIDNNHHHHHYHYVTSSCWTKAKIIQNQNRHHGAFLPLAQLAWEEGRDLENQIRWGFMMGLVVILCWDHDSVIIVWQDQQTSKNHGDTHRNSSAEVDEGDNRQDVGHHLLKATLRWWFRTITAVLPATEMRTNATFSKVWVILTSRAPPIRKFTCRLPGKRLNKNIYN